MISILYAAIIAEVVSLIVVWYASDEKGIALMRALKALAIGWVLVIFLIAYRAASTHTSTWDVIWALLAGALTYLLYRGFVAAHKRSLAAPKTK